MLKHKTIEVEGFNVLAVTWQDDEQKPSIRWMTHAHGIYAEQEIAYPDEAERAKAFDNDAYLQDRAESLVDLVSDAVGGD